MPLRLAWLFGLALMAPIALPAGGADRDQPGLRRRRTGERRRASVPAPDLRARPGSGGRG